jgi:predicted anti-sigma-YlaC factor YlaD
MDRHQIDCERCRTAISARLDDEDAGVPSVDVHAHLARCASCRAFEVDVTSLHRVLRVAPAPEVPDLTARILASIGDTPRSSTHRDAWRACLAVVAVIQIVLGLPALVLGTDAGLPVHTARHLGSFAVALGVGFLVVAVRPDRAAGLFPLAAALVACLVLTSAVDVASGRTAALGELTHSTELLGLALCWIVGRSAVSAPPTARHVLRGAA